MEKVRNVLKSSNIQGYGTCSKDSWMRCFASDRRETLRRGVGVGCQGNLYGGDGLQTLMFGDLGFDLQVPQPGGQQQLLLVALQRIAVFFHFVTVFRYLRNLPA